MGVPQKLLGLQGRIPSGNGWNGWPSMPWGSPIDGNPHMIEHDIKFWSISAWLMCSFAHPAMQLLRHPRQHVCDHASLKKFDRRLWKRVIPRNADSFWGKWWTTVRFPNLPKSFRQTGSTWHSFANVRRFGEVEFAPVKKTYLSMS